MKNKIKKIFVTNNLLGKAQRNKFESGGYFYYSGQRDTFAKAVQLIKINEGRALDVGAGFGNETKQLLKCGFEVVATDTNPEASNYLQKIANKNSKLIVLTQALPTFPNGKFDFIVCEMVLHFLNKKDAYESVTKMQNATNVGGYNIISSYLEQPAIHKDPRIEPDYFKFLLDKGELKSLYRNWHIEYYEEKSNTMSFKSARLIVRKV